MENKEVPPSEHPSVKSDDGGCIAHIVVIGFHHSKGHQVIDLVPSPNVQVEFCYPEEANGNTFLQMLPFLGLPDGAHLSEEGCIHNTSSVIYSLNVLSSISIYHRKITAPHPY